MGIMVHMAVDLTAAVLVVAAPARFLSEEEEPFEEADDTSFFAASAQAVEAVAVAAPVYDPRELEPVGA